MYVGVDGCPAGWFVARYDGSTFDCACLSTFADVVDAHRGARRLFVDIPIGLPSDGRRACDEAARSLLGSRASTVFFTPCRAVLDADSHAEASAANREQTGYGLSIQAWHLVPRIRAVDEVLRGDGDGDGDADADFVVESHPELCFRAFAGGTPVAESKSTPEGRARRLELLAERAADARRAYDDALDSHYRREVARDDVLDALALAVAAGCPSTRLPDGPAPRDDTGLPMTITAPRLFAAAKFTDL